MTKKKDSLGSMIFWLFFLALIFGGDIVEFAGVGTEGDPTMYLLLFGGIIVFALVAYRIKKLFSGMTNMVDSHVPTGQQQSAQVQHSANFKSTLHSEQERTTAQTVTGEPVNPFSINGK